MKGGLHRDVADNVLFATQSFRSNLWAPDRSGEHATFWTAMSICIEPASTRDGWVKGVER